MIDEPAIELYYHDDQPARDGERHGPMGPTHCFTAKCDFEYQAEQWVIDAGSDYPGVVMIECPILGRRWRRVGQEFEEIDAQEDLRDAG